MLAQVVRVELAEQQQPSSSTSTTTAVGGCSVLLPEPEAILDAPDWAKPNRGWVQQFVADFQQLRMQVQQAYEQQGGWVPQNLDVLLCCSAATWQYKGDCV